jgi:hypothetical protein
MPGSVEKQTRLIMENIQSILSSCGAGWTDVIVARSLILSSCPLKMRLEKYCLGRFSQHPVLVFWSQEGQPVANKV